jgi:hypothetical protein
VLWEGFRHKHATRIVIYDDDLAVPLIQARLTAAEIEAMRKVLDTRK